VAGENSSPRQTKRKEKLAGNLQGKGAKGSEEKNERLRIVPQEGRTGRQTTQMINGWTGGGEAT